MPDDRGLKTITTSGPVVSHIEGVVFFPRSSRPQRCHKGHIGYHGVWGWMMGNTSGDGKRREQIVWERDWFKQTKQWEPEPVMSNTLEPVLSLLNDSIIHGLRAGMKTSTQDNTVICLMFHINCTLHDAKRVLTLPSLTLTYPPRLQLYVSSPSALLQFTVMEYLQQYYMY